MLCNKRNGFNPFNIDNYIANQDAFYFYAQIYGINGFIYGFGWFFIHIMNK